MTEITNIGNLPHHLQVMAKEVEGVRSTRFYECTNVTELLNHAKDGKCEESTITIDQKSEKGFAVAFSFDESELTDLAGDKLIVMNVFFAELTDYETREYRAMLHQHRNDQEDNMEQRRASAASKAKMEIKEVIND